MKYLILCITTIGLTLISRTAFTQTAEVGQKIYQRNCTRCHGKNGKRGFMGAKDLSKSTLEIGVVKSVVKNGRGIMPSWKNDLTADEIDNVAVYVLTLRQKP